MKRLLIRYKSQLLYALFGTITTIIDIAVYQLCFESLGIPNIPSNVIAWVLSVAFSFVTNKIWVYGSRSIRAKTIIKEFLAYYTGRGISLVAGTAIMVVGVDIFKWDSLVTKLISNIFVVIINYAFGFIVFKKIEEYVRGKD